MRSLLRGRLDALDAAGSLRRPDAEAGSGQASGPAVVDRRLDLSSNDYLGLGRRNVSRETLDAIRHAPPGGRASRLIFGTHAAHLELERELANWVQQPAALLFSSGYAANVGTLAALAGPGDVVFSDALNHASIIDGCRLSAAEIRVYPHGDLPSLERQLATHVAGHRWIVTESYFSMDGDTPDLGALAAIGERHGASLILDEAHALGVFGPAGAGLARAAGVKPDVLVGTLGKAIGAQGAFVAGSPELRAYLWNRARSLVFSTAPSPILAALTLEQVRRTRAAASERARLHESCRQLRETLHAAGVPVLVASHGPIVPVVLGTNAAALAAAEALAEQGIQARAIRPPTVPDGTARLRITVDAALQPGDIALIAQALAAVAGTRCCG